MVCTITELDGSESSVVNVDFSDQIDAELSQEGARRYQPGCGITHTFGVADSAGARPLRLSQCTATASTGATDRT